MIRLCLAKQKLEKDENINTHVNNVILFLSHRECGTSWKSFLNFSIKYFHCILYWKFRVGVMYQKQMLGSTRFLYYRQEVLYFLVNIFYSAF